MLDPALSEFFAVRKEAWLKKNIKASMDDVEINQLNIDCDDVFEAKSWLPNAARRAGQISIATHPCTFSHPSSRKNKNGYASSVIARTLSAADGFLRSGNVNVEPDALGNAAALDVYKYLTTKLADGQTLLTHLEQDSPQAKIALDCQSQDESCLYDVLKDGFMVMLQSGGESITSSKIKQVYFPVDDDLVVGDQDKYHQLSILSPSGIMFDLRKRLDTLRFSDEVKAARSSKKSNKEGASYKEIYNLTTIGYGGTKPQNISVLNNANGGKVHLFMSLPPSFAKRDTTFPTKDFFTQSVRINTKACRSVFYALHALYKQDQNNMHVREKRDELYQDIVDYMLGVLWEMRVAKDQFLASHSQLPSQQKIWLQVTPHPDNDDWLDGLLSQITQFIFQGYEAILGKKAIKLGDAEYKHIAKLVDNNKELLR